MADWSIIEATTKELDLAARLFDEYRQFYRYPSDVAAARNFLQARMNGRESRIFLSVKDSNAGGFMQIYPSFSSLSLKNTWILYDLFVAPAARRQGIAAQLLERARALGVDSGAAELTLSTAKDNATAQSVYRRSGWRLDEAFDVYSLAL